MKLIVGLGNPGDLYRDSKHNVGFSVVRALAEDLKAHFKRDRGTFSLSAKAKINSQAVMLAMPLTFMNLSGNAVRDLLKKYKIDQSDLLVVCDDLDLEFGRLRLRPSGTSAGQKGIQSIIESLASREFSRLRIGIGRPPVNTDASDYVLSRFSSSQRRELKEVIQEAILCCSTWVKEGTAKAMSNFNRRSNNHEEV